MLSLESVQKHLNYLKSIKQNQRLELHEKSQEPEPQPLPRSQHYRKPYHRQSIPLFNFQILCQL